MNQFLERHNLPNLTQGEVYNLNWSISTREIESISNVQKQKVQAPDGSTGEFYCMFKEEIDTNSLQPFPENEGQHYHDAKTRERYHKEGKSVSIFGLMRDQYLS